VRTRELWGELSTSAKVLPILAVLGFFVRLTSTSRSISNGEVTSCTYIDFAALFFALVCVVGGIALARRGIRAPQWQDRALSTAYLVIGTVVAALGVVHALRGLGILAGPC
jgi:hypothetical protein